MSEIYQKLKNLQQRIIEREEEIYHDTYFKTDSDYSEVKAQTTTVAIRDRLKTLF